MFWINNLNELFNPVLIPTENMTLEEKLNTISRLILFIGIISAFIFKIYIIYYYNVNNLYSYL